jgi:hypothetical protein
LNGGRRFAHFHDDGLDEVECDDIATHASHADAVTDVERLASQNDKVTFGWVKSRIPVGPTALTKELGVSRRQLSRWRDELDPEEPRVGKLAGEESRVSTLRKEVNHLKRVLAEKTLEVDFFRSALQKVEARRQQSSRSGEKASTIKFRE